MEWPLLQRFRTRVQLPPPPPFHVHPRKGRKFRPFSFQKFAHSRLVHRLTTEEHPAPTDTDKNTGATAYRLSTQQGVSERRSEIEAEARKSDGVVTSAQRGWRHGLQRKRRNRGAPVRASLLDRRVCPNAREPLGDYLRGRAFRRFARTRLRLLVTGFVVSAASNKCRKPCSNSSTALSKAPSCPTRTIATDRRKSNDGGRNTSTVSRQFFLAIKRAGSNPIPYPD